MLRPAHDSRNPEPTIATIRPLRNSARKAGVTRTPRISALSRPRSPLRYRHALNRCPSATSRGGDRHDRQQVGLRAELARPWPREVTSHDPAMSRRDSLIGQAPKQILGQFRAMWAHRPLGLRASAHASPSGLGRAPVPAAPGAEP
jgi:hypothetical protein